MEYAVAVVIRQIEKLGLSISPQKTEVCAFSRAHRFVHEEVVVIKGYLIPVNADMKYLGLVLSRKWSFREHFNRLLPKAERMTLALARIMPNLRSPNEHARKLYCGVIHSVIFYGAPVWAPTLRTDKRTTAAIQAVQRKVALRVVAAYKTVSCPAAFLLAKVIPVDYLADRYKDVYMDTRAIQEKEIRITQRMHDTIRERALDAALTKWKNVYSRPTAVEVRRVLVHNLFQWYKRARGHLTYRMTLMITSHGCFNDCTE
ncbi:PREDICTED: uncharacterized protein LOC105448385 [Wasmannia auropunctata]|uniref:uncharacterized protein LOC105448385 n=1 Tax=Wasmannia auropunctata TaxID=64793 RepID=UPI0005F09F3B|nr:PREDICTED: uncharacterized protein LOC105448385 [Wasmannia auropunctata]